MKKRILLGLTILFLSAGCAQRAPSPQTAHTKLTKYFQKYGKKYKNSEFGRHPVGKIEIASVREIQKKLAEADAYVALLNGPTYGVRAIFERKALGWKIVSWENLGTPTSAAGAKKSGGSR